MWVGEAGVGFPTRVNSASPRRHSSRTADLFSPGPSAAGESPRAVGGRRTRSADGAIVNRSGGSRMTASPSIPTATPEPESTSNCSAVHSLHPSNFRI